MIEKRNLNGIIALSLTLIVAACATSGEEVLRSTVDGHPAGGSGLVVNWIGDDIEVISYGRVSGSPEKPMTLDDLIVVDATEHSWGNLQIAVHNEDAEELNNALFSADPHESERDRESFRLALDETITGFSGLNGHTLNVYAVAAPEGSGRTMYLRARSPDSISIMVMIGIDYPSEIPAFNEPSYWMSVIGSKVVHEMFHLNNRISEVQAQNVNEETAAYLLEHCFVVRMANRLGGSSDINFDVSSPLIQSIFPGIEKGEFSPRKNQLSRLGHPSHQGRNLAAAVLMHISQGGVFQMDNPDMIDPLFAICDRSVDQIPDFRAGKLR